jgi:UDP-N-acetylglucosamine 2-epimerase (non-hydrolysing)
MMEFEKVVEQQEPDLILVVGDVNSTMACSIVASKMGVKIGHVEAGLRSFDRTMPEEINRLVTDALADYLFVTEKSGLENLQREGISAGKIFFTGNVMIDSLVYFMHKSQKSDILKRMNLDDHPYALITLHRPSNVDIKENFEKLLDAFAVIQEDLKIVFPIHPRSQKMLNNFGLNRRINSMKNLVLIDPIGYLDFIQLMRKSKLVLTDSGGIQAETTFLSVPCLTLRENTEQPVTIEIGTNILVGLNSQRIIVELQKIIQNKARPGKIPELWDGHAAERIVKIITERSM